MMRSASSVIVFLLLFPALASAAAEVQENGGALEAAEAAICRKVVALECIDPGSAFNEDVENLFCFSRITGARSETFVTHVWYYKDAEIARVQLPVRSDNWRTYSSKRIGPTHTGPWRVEILGPSGRTLKVLPFEIIP